MFKKMFITEGTDTYAFWELLILNGVFLEILVSVILGIQVYFIRWSVN